MTPAKDITIGELLEAQGGTMRLKNILSRALGVYALSVIAALTWNCVDRTSYTPVVVLLALLAPITIGFVGAFTIAAVLLIVRGWPKDE